MFEITALVNAKITAGVLPAIHIGQIWVGDGTEIRCECCEQNTSLSVQEGRSACRAPSRCGCTDGATNIWQAGIDKRGETA